MPARTLIRVIGLLLAGTIGAGAAPPRLPDATDELLYSARVWEARDRGDLARLALEKLVAARPNRPDILLRLGELDLRLGDVEAARRILDRLQSRFAATPVARTFAIEYRVATSDRLQLASIGRLVQLGRTQDALAELSKLFPEGAPIGALGIDYYRLLARLPGGWEKSHVGLRSLVAAYPEDPRYQLALAQHLLKRPATEQEGLGMLFRLAARDDLRRADIDDALDSAIKSVGYRRVPRQELQAYLRRNPADRAAAQILTSRDDGSEANKLQAANARAKIRPELQAELRERLAATLRARIAAAPGDTAAREAMAALELSPGNAAASWAEAVVGAAKAAEEAGGAEEAGDMLVVAHRLQPRSNWIFTNYVRWLASHARAAEALTLADGRALDRKWTREARDELRAYVLDQRSQAELREGRETAALADLEAAHELAPKDPWIRYRLAQRYAASGDEARGRRLLAGGVTAAPGDPDTRYALALYLSSAGAYEDSLAALEGIPAAQRTPGMTALRSRAQIAMARATARRLKQAGDIEGARTALRGAESLVGSDIALARELASAWIELGEPEHGLGLVRSQLDAGGPNVREAGLAWAEVLDDAGETGRLAEALARLRAMPAADADSVRRIDRLQRSLDMREVRALENTGRYALAARRLDEMLAATPENRTLRVARADLDLQSRQPSAAMDRYAILVAEDPDDLDTRLSYVRALTESGETDEARRQLQAVLERAPADAFDLRFSVARRQLALGDMAAAADTLRDVSARAQTRGASDTAALARNERERIEERRQSWTMGGLEIRHKAGDAGISLFDSLQVPTEWGYASGYDAYYVARADVVNLDSGELPHDFASAALLGTVQAAGPGSVASLLDPRTAQTGVSLGIGYRTDSFQADLGTTPLGFLLTNIVGGVKWTPTVGPVDLSLGFARRAVTSSVLSYAGLRDPVSGRTWGGVVETGPTARAGYYGPEFSLSGSLRYARLTGEHVLGNSFVGLRISGDWKFLESAGMRGYLGSVLNYWDYAENLLGYTFGSGGYYSPQAYLNIALPVEVIGERGHWSYRARVAVAYSRSDSKTMPFYPQDPALQAAASTQPLPPGFDRPFYEGGVSSGISYSLYGAIERLVTNGLVLGAMLDIDRADFYKPITFMFYARHAFGDSRTRIAVPPRPIDLYSNY